MTRGATIRMWRRSLLVLIIIVGLGFGLLVCRLVTIQIVDGQKLQGEAVQQQLNDTKLTAQRGSIYDRNMKLLAQSASVWNVVLEPAYLKEEKNKQLVVEGLAPILSMDPSDLYEKIEKNSKSYYYIVKRKVELDVKEKIVAFKAENNITNGIRLIEDYKRYYPYGHFASSILGFTGSEGQGLSGIENYYNEYLTGTSGRIVTARNAVGTDMPFEYEKMIEPKNGCSLVLNIDETVQNILEKGLEEGIKNNDVKNRATAIIMDVNTGAILGMSVKEDYDPNDPFTVADETEAARIASLPQEEQSNARVTALEQQWRNKAVSDTYYPGSVYKMVTASMCLQENIFNESSMFNCSGSIQVGGSNLGCHYRSGHGSENFCQALWNSCNPAFATMGLTLGAEKFYNYYCGFGFSDKTGIDLPGESDDIFFSKDGSMGITDLAVASFGQNFSITPIQMLTAACAVANGGKVVQPHIVSHIIDEQNNIVKSYGTEVKRQVISEDVSRRMCDILMQNAIDGSGRNGYVEGYRIAGKTGTSEKIADYRATGVMTYIASYCGFAPADDPKIAMLVFYDNPQGGSYYGAMVAAPTFKSVMEQVLPYLGIEKKYSEDELKNMNIKMPNVLGKTVTEAKLELANQGLICKVYGDGEQITMQIPEPEEQVPENGSIALYTQGADFDSGLVEVPKLTNMTLSEVNQITGSLGLNVSISGTVLNDSEVISISQSIDEGTKVSPGTVIVVSFGKSDNVL